MFPLTNNLNVGGFLLQNTGLSSPIQLHDNLHAIEKYSSDLGAAIAGIGSSSVTLLIGKIISVSGTHTIPANIHLWFVGQGALSTSGGSTVTFATPSQITATTSQTIFSGSGTILFTAAGVVSPAWFGFLATATAAANTTAYNACTASLSTAGGVVIVPPGTYSVNDSLTHGNKPITVIGAHPEMSIISSTSTTSQDHGMIFTRSFQVRHLQIKTSTDLTTNNQQDGIRLDLDGVTVSGGNQSVRIEDVKVRGFNVGLYVDGGDAYNVDRCILQDIDIQVAGPGTSYVGSCIYMNRVTQLYMNMIQLDQNNTGEHAIYNFGTKNQLLENLKIRNATKSEAQAIKLVGQAQGGGLDDERFPVWEVRNADISNCTNGIFVTTYGTEKLGALRLSNMRFDDIDGTLNVPGCIYIQAKGTSTIETTLIENIIMNDLGYEGFRLSTEAGARFIRTTIKDIAAANWSSVSAGTYMLFSTNGAGDYGTITLEKVDADGESNGRSVVGYYGSATSFVKMNVNFNNIWERNTTNPERPINLVDGDTTPSCAIGRHLYVNNTSPTTITRFDDVVRGEQYLFEFANSNTTVSNSARIILAGGSNFSGTSNDMLLLVCRDDTAGSTIMKEISRSVN